MLIIDRVRHMIISSRGSHSDRHSFIGNGNRRVLITGKWTSRGRYLIHWTEWENG